MQTLNLSLRPFSQDDYTDLTHLTNVTYPEYPITEEEIRGFDKRRDPKIRWQRLMLEQDGTPLGFGLFENMAWMFHPQKFFVEVNIHPDYRGQGLGTRLYKALMSELASYKPTVIRTRVREDMSSGVAFAQKQGFTEDTRDFESRLDPNSLSFAHLEGLKEAIAKEGISFMRLDEYMRLEPDYKQKLYNLDMEVSKDVPYPEGESHTSPSFETWTKNFFENPNFQPEAHLLAMHQGDVIGFNSLWPTQAEPDCMYNGLTAVKREFRRKGIAKTLKLENLKWVRDQGYKVVKTWNNSQNKGMLAINEALGFKRQPAWIILKKVLHEDND